MLTMSARSSIVGHLLLKAVLKTHEDVSKSLREYRITRDNEDLGKLIDSICNTMNPFTLDTDENLYCLTSGAKVNDSIKDDLLSIQTKGTVLYEEFVGKCFSDPTRFEKPIKKKKITNFASAAVKSSMKTKDLKVLELQGTRDLFGRLLYISTNGGIDLEHVFRFPLTPVPLSLCHLDGSINKTDKAKLFHMLEGRVESRSPEIVESVVVDGLFFLHSQVLPPITYGKIVEDLLEKLVRMAPRVDFVCDSYISPSLKDIERIRQGNSEQIFSITGPEQTRSRLAKVSQVSIFQ